MKETTRRLLRHVLTNNCAKEINWKGKNGKRAFSAMHMKSVIIREFTDSCLMMMMITMNFYVLDSFARGLGRCVLKLIRGTFLVHRSNFGHMPSWCHRWSLIGVGGTQTQVHASTSWAMTACCQLFTHCNCLFLYLHWNYNDNYCNWNFCTLLSAHVFIHILSSGLVLKSFVLYSRP